MDVVDGVERNAKDRSWLDVLHRIADWFLVLDIVALLIMLIGAAVLSILE
jgi:hypothetical protein